MKLKCVLGIENNFVFMAILFVKEEFRVHSKCPYK
jgi:hypothetical protein